MTKVKTGERAFDGWPTTLDDIYFIYANSYNDQGTWRDSPFKILQLGAGGIHRGIGQAWRRTDQDRVPVERMTRVIRSPSRAETT